VEEIDNIIAGEGFGGTIFAVDAVELDSQRRETGNKAAAIIAKQKRIEQEHAKKIQTTIKLQLPAGKATPAPPVGTLGPARL